MTGSIVLIVDHPYVHPTPNVLPVQAFIRKDCFYVAIHICIFSCILVLCFHVKASE